MGYYPVFVNLRGRRAVVVGGGRVAERKVAGLVRARAAVRVISPTLTPRLASLAAEKKISFTPRAYRKGDLKGAALAFAATDDPVTQRAVRRDAEAAGTFVNLADNRRDSSFLVPASFSRGDLIVAISTSGASPALARRLRRQLQRTAGNKPRTLVRFLREARRQLKEMLPDQKQRARLLRRLAAEPADGWSAAAGPAQVRREVRKRVRQLQAGMRESGRGKKRERLLGGPRAGNRLVKANRQSE